MNAHFSTVTAASFTCMVVSLVWYTVGVVLHMHILNYYSKTSDKPCISAFVNPNLTMHFLSLLKQKQVYQNFVKSILYKRVTLSYNVLLTNDWPPKNASTSLNCMCCWEEKNMYILYFDFHCVFLHLCGIFHFWFDTFFKIDNILDQYSTGIFLKMNKATLIRTAKKTQN